MAVIIDGQHKARGLRQRIAAAVTQLKATTGQQPGLAVIQLGNHPASRIYVKRKGEQTREVGMRSLEKHLAAELTASELLDLIEMLNRDETIHGILVQLPLPPHLDAQQVIAAIHPEKDVDGFHPVNIGRLWGGLKGFIPCTPLGCLYLLGELGELAGKRALVLGRSNIVGKPMAGLLLQQHCTVQMAHSKSQGIEELCRESDIVIAALGQPHFVKGEWLKSGSWIIDVGINRVEENAKSRIVGDVDFESALGTVGAITPVPGGVGPMTIACLLVNTLTAFCNQLAVQNPLNDDHF